ncbi:MAG TPA: Ku protein [Dehalococcoidales bacterium]|nr:Ku protein [Dehalococcoidales bacterium]
MPKAFWKGVISFGLVAIPVKMYVGAESKSISFHMLHKKCLTRPKQVLHCDVDDEYFSSKDTVRGYEVAKGQFVVVEDKDLEKVPIRTARSIDILGFVDANDIDPLYYYNVHYVEPEDLGAKPFCLLKEALVKTGRAGIAKVSFARREHLGCLRPLGDILLLHTLHYEDEVHPYQEITPPQPAYTDAEFNMALNLVKAMARDFNPKEYKDEYEAALKKLVEAKIAGRKIIVPEIPKTEIGDLMAALRESVKAAKKEPVLSKA